VFPGRLTGFDITECRNNARIPLAFFAILT
jgi:hypothetical protein